LTLALKLFSNLISKNIEVILNSDPTKDCCPCLQMIHEIDNSRTNLNDCEKDTMLGILWLYCDVLKSRKYFGKLLKNEPSNENYKTINKIINQQFSIN
jgi:hypothetical protein